MKYVVISRPSEHHITFRISANGDELLWQSLSSNHAPLTFESVASAAEWASNRLYLRTCEIITLDEFQVIQVMGA